MSARAPAPLALAVILLCGAARAESPVQGASRLEVGQPAPSFVMRTINPARSGIEFFSTRKVFDPAATPRTRALVLAFAASYCGPCKRELPELIALAARYPDPTVKWAVVVIDQDDAGREAMRRWLVDELVCPLPLLADRFGLLARRYAADQLPYLVVVDAGGAVRWVRTGYHPDTLTALQAQLDAPVRPAGAAAQPR